MENELIQTTGGSAVTTDNRTIEQTEPLYLYISSARLVLMSILSFGIYEVYWLYKNWWYLKNREHLDIKPFWRGWFGIFFCHSLLHHIYNDDECNAIQQPQFSHSTLATIWVILILIANIVGRFPGATLSMMSALIPSYLCFVPVQNYINSVMKKRSPSLRHYRWSAGHTVSLVPGLIIWILLFIVMNA